MDKAWIDYLHIVETNPIGAEVIFNSPLAEGAYAKMHLARIDTATHTLHGTSDGKAVSVTFAEPSELEKKTEGSGETEGSGDDATKGDDAETVAQRPRQRQHGKGR